MSLEVRILGRVEYEDALRMQEQLVGLRQNNRIPDQILFVEHPSIFTLGRRANSEHVLISPAMQEHFGVGVFESVRGGDVTYHGPGQVVMYPIVQLPLARQDVVRYVRDLEHVMILTLADFGITAQRIEGLSGCWVGSDKVGAIGVRMSRWVTSHGIALNVNTDLRYFELIVPCGIRDHGVTSMARLLGHSIDEERVRKALEANFSAVFYTRPGAELTRTTESPIDYPPLDLATIQAIVFRNCPDLQLLVLHRTPSQGDFWQPVTGRIEPGETPEQAAHREVWEETGLRGKLEDLNYRHVFMLDSSIFPAPLWPVPCFVREFSFALEVDAAARLSLDPSAHDDAAWLSPTEAIERQKWPGNVEAMKRVHAGRRDTIKFPGSGG